MDRFDEDWGWLPHEDDTIKACVRGLIGFNLMIGAEAEDDFLGKEKRCSFIIIVFVQKALCTYYRLFFWAILWRLIEALASDGLSFLPIP